MRALTFWVKERLRITQPVPSKVTNYNLILCTNHFVARHVHCVYL